MHTFITMVWIICLILSTYIMLSGIKLCKLPDNNVMQLFSKEKSPTSYKHLNIEFLNVEIFVFIVFLLVSCAISLLHFETNIFDYRWIIGGISIFSIICLIVFGINKKYLLKPLKCLFVFTNNTLINIYPQAVSQYHKQNIDSDTAQHNVSTREKTMLKDIIHFGNETVKDILTAHTDIVYIDYNTPYVEALKIISTNKYSRIPVYSKSKDNIVGILYIKDLLAYLEKPSNFHWQTLVRPHLCVPETKKIDNLLHEFQTKKIHFAVVIDEYGGVAGIVTMEDIIEEIVGEINDEFDDEKEPYIKLNKNAYIFDAKTSTPTICKVFGVNDSFFDEFGEDANTLATLVIDIIGDLPRKHQVVKYKQFVFEVLKMDARHISKVKVSRL